MEGGGGRLCGIEGGGGVIWYGGREWGLCGMEGRGRESFAWVEEGGRQACSYSRAHTFKVPLHQ